MPEHEYCDNVCIMVAPGESATRVIRLATTAMASSVGLDIDQADDLNTALEELFKLSGGTQEVTSSEICVKYAVHQDRLEVKVVGVPFDLSDASKKVNRYSRFVIDSITDALHDQPNPAGGYDILLVKRIIPR